MKAIRGTGAAGHCNLHTKVISLQANTQEGRCAHPWIALMYCCNTRFLDVYTPHAMKAIHRTTAVLYDPFTQRLSVANQLLEKSCAHLWTEGGCRHRQFRRHTIWSVFTESTGSPFVCLIGESHLLGGGILAPSPRRRRPEVVSGVSWGPCTQRCTRIQSSNPRVVTPTPGHSTFAQVKQSGVSLQNPKDTPRLLAWTVHSLGGGILGPSPRRRHPEVVSRFGDLAHSSAKGPFLDIIVFRICDRLDLSGFQRQDYAWLR